MSATSEEFKVTVTSIVGKRGPAALLTLDVSLYLQAVKKYQEIIFSEQKEAHSQAYFEQKSVLKHLRSKVNRLISGLPGQGVWHEIIKKLHGAAIDNDEFEPLKAALSAIVADDASARPLVLAVMEGLFSELLKNSLDALIKRYTEQPNSASPILNVQFELAYFNEAKQLVSLSIHDNGGGFSEPYLAMAEKLKVEERLSLPYQSQKNICSTPIFFGGRGLGLRLLHSALLFGKMLQPGRRGEPMYDFSSQPYTDIQLRNVRKEGRFGAELMLVSPLAPIPSLLADFSPRFLTSTASHRAPEQRAPDAIVSAAAETGGDGVSANSLRKRPCLIIEIPTPDTATWFFSPTSSWLDSPFSQPNQKSGEEVSLEPSVKAPRR